MKLNDLLLISICNNLILHYATALECPSKWGSAKWPTVKYLTSCLTLVPLSEIEHCARETPTERLIHGQKYPIECIDKYCDDHFPFGYFWTWIPNEQEEKRDFQRLMSEFWFTLHGAAFVCTRPAENNGSHYPCITERSNRSIHIQGNNLHEYEDCYGVPGTETTSQRSCQGFFMHSLNQNVDKHYICSSLKFQGGRLRMTYGKYCNRMNYTFFTCGHEGTYPCEKKRTFGCNFNKDLNRCVSYYYTKAAPDREKYQRCTIDYGSTCNCTCRNNYTQWTSWSSTCKPSSRMRIAPFAQPSEELSPVHCSFENRTQCCVQTEDNLSSELEKCTNYIYGTSVSLVKHNCSRPYGTRIVDEKGHYKCQCSGGYGGILCQDEPRSCVSKPCKNGGTCTGDGELYLCACKPGFKGFQCEQQYKGCDKGEECLNRGVCRKSHDTHVCGCTSEYTGVHCEYEAKYCTKDTCLPNGVCQNITSLRTFRCHCQKPYGGRHCDYAVNYCTADSCNGHGVCHNLTRGRTKCVCYRGYVGKSCAFSLYLSIIPVCICVVVLILGGLLILRKRRKKKALTAKAAARRTSRSLRSSVQQAKPVTSPTSPEEPKKKRPKPDYVLPVFSSSSVSQITAGSAKPTLGTLVLGNSLKFGLRKCWFEKNVCFFNDNMPEKLNFRFESDGMYVRYAMLSANVDVKCLGNNSETVNRAAWNQQVTIALYANYKNFHNQRTYEESDAVARRFSISLEDVKIAVKHLSAALWGAALR